MDFTTKQWIISVILVVIIAILIDGVRRMRNARRDSLQMSLKVKKTVSMDIDEDNYGSEFPNGGARASQKTIDKERIDKIKRQYDFGRDLSIKPRLEKKTAPIATNESLESPESDTVAASINSIDSNEEYQTVKGELYDEINSDQWVDSDDNDEEYYAEKWDEEINLDDDNEDQDDDGYDLGDTPYDHVQLGDGNLDDDDIDYKPIAEKQVTVKLHNTKQENIKKSYQQPEQVPLNLEESVPVLMESVVEEDDSVDVEVIAEKNRADNSIEEEKVETKNSARNKAAAIRSVAKRIKSASSTTEEDEPLETHSANKPRYESKYFSNDTQKEKTSVSPSLQEVLVVNVKTVKDGAFHGSDLLQQVLENGLRYGAMNIFHRHADEDGEGPVIFSMANMLKPGTFDLKTMDEFSTAGVTLFLTLPVFDNNNMAAFDLMIETAKNLAASLNGELNDENRSIMTSQTIEHYRERIRDFSRRQQLEKKR